MDDWHGAIVVVVSISTAWSDPDAPNPAALAGHVGAICAADFAARGGSVLVVDPDEAALAALQAGVARSGGALETVQAGLTDEVALQAAAQVCAERFGRADVLVTAHTAIERHSIEDSDFASWRRIVDENLLGPVFAAKAFLPLLKKSGRSAIVHIGSIDGALGNPQFPAYSASKGGIGALTHVMAHEFARYGIRVNCVARAMIAEPEQQPPADSLIVRHTPLGRAGRPSELAAVVRFLASPAAAYVTGAVVPVDGGRSGLTPGTIS